MPIYNVLPDHSYVPFKVMKLNAPELVWVNPEMHKMAGLTEDELLSNYAYVTHDYISQSGLNEQDWKIFLADRYGSRYEACNGGSARCGIFNNWQVKGIGRNPLIAINIDKDHSHGKLCLTKAISEAVWGEICHRELPYGAIRTLAIIKTGAWIEASYGRPGNHVQPCALAIREIAIRPAHFERATFFWPENKYIQLRNDDALRVQLAVERLHHFLPGGEKGLVKGLTNFVKRMACQIAVSRIKGIPHGSLTSSNISIDGRFLDFGTLSSVSDFDNYLLAAGQGGVWDDHHLIAEWLRHLGFFINKYHSEKLNPQRLNTLIAYFYDCLDKQENKSLALHVGLQGCELFLEENGSKVKEKLRNGKRKSKIFNGFDNNDFINQLSSALLPLGISASSAMFPLRHKRFSIYTLTQAIKDKIVNYGADRGSISKLIESYIARETDRA
ncbi:MAG: protein adenylyltransferase SelO family protein [Silvania sp.]